MVVVVRKLKKQNGGSRKALRYTKSNDHKRRQDIFENRRKSIIAQFSNNPPIASQFSNNPKIQALRRRAQEYYSNSRRPTNEEELRNYLRHKAAELERKERLERERQRRQLRQQEQEEEEESQDHSQ